MWHLGLLYAAQIVGWVYFVSWSVSFYPQIYLNWKRKSVVGFSFDMALMDVLGFLAYTIYTVTLYCDASLQKYFHSLENQHFRDRDNTVKLTDVVFASHGLIMAFITVSQVLIYERGNQRLSKIAGGLCSLGSLGFVVLVIVAASEKGQSVSNWASPLIYAGYFKSGLSFIKVRTLAYFLLREDWVGIGRDWRIWRCWTGKEKYIKQVLRVP